MWKKHKSYKKANPGWVSYLSFGYFGGKNEGKTPTKPSTGQTLHDKYQTTLAGLTAEEQKKRKALAAAAAKAARDKKANGGWLNSLTGGLIGGPSKPEDKKTKKTPLTPERSARLEKNLATMRSKVMGKVKAGTRVAGAFKEAAKRGAEKRTKKETEALTKELEAARKNNERLTSDKNRFESDLKKTRADLGKTQGELTAAEQAKADALMKNNDLNNSLGETKDQLKNVEGEKNELETDLENNKDNGQIVKSGGLVGELGRFDKEKGEYPLRLAGGHLERIKDYKMANKAERKEFTNERAEQQLDLPAPEKTPIQKIKENASVANDYLKENVDPYTVNPIKSVVKAAYDSMPALDLCASKSTATTSA